VDVRVARRHTTPLLAFLLAATIAAPPPAAAAEHVAVATPEELPPKPDGYAVSARSAFRTARATEEVAEHAARDARLEADVDADDNRAWRVGFSAGDDVLALVLVDGVTGAIREVWTGEQVAWPMARGYEGQFGHILNAPWIWLPLCAVFVGLLVEWRRPLRIAHLDLVALLAFGASHVFFNRAEIGVSVPLAYPVLAYLLARSLWVGFRGGEPLRPTAPAALLAVVAVFVIAFRVTINVADSGVIDVGYAGAIGADRITHGEAIYGEGEFPDDNRFGDTYGPANYYAYVPFELAFPWSGEWDELAASHAAAIAFDLATVLGLVAFAVRLRPGRPGRELAALLAFAWLAYPYTAFALQSNANDSLVAALVVWSLALFTRPVARGALLALAAMVKFAPLALVPLFAAGERGLGAAGRERRPLRRAAAFGVAFAAVCALVLAHPAVDPGLATFWERTAENQLDRSSPFSVWGQVDGIDWVQTATLLLTAVLGVLVAFVPRQRSIAQVAALTAAVLIALQLGVDHWFYLYIPWFAGPLLIALATMRPLGREPVAAAAGSD
jgi:hypothetical protein